MTLASLAFSIKNKGIPFLSFLQVAARVAEELVLLAEHLASTELPKTRSYAGVLLDIYRQIEETFVT